MEKSKISLGVQTRRHLHARLKPLGFKYKKSSYDLINTIEGVEFRISLGGPSWPGSCIRFFNVAFRPVRFNQLLDEIHYVSIQQIGQSAWRESICIVTQSQLFNMGVVDVAEYDIRSSEEAENVANEIAGHLIKYVFNRVEDYKNPYFIEYLRKCRLEESLHGLWANDYLIAKLTDAGLAENYERELLKKIHKLKDTHKPSSEMTKNYFSYLKPLTTGDLWQRIGTKDSLELKIQAFSILLFELDIWLTAKHTQYSEVQKLQNSVQNYKALRPESFERHLNSLSRQFWDHDLPSIPSATMDRLLMLWKKIRLQLQPSK